MALGVAAAAALLDRPIVYGSYPITPASALLHRLASFKGKGVRTFQAEDEIAAIGSAIGLGNVWRFSYMEDQHGGGAFLVPYLVALIVAGIPIMILEYGVGHREKGSSPLSFPWRRNTSRPDIKLDE